MDDDDPDLVQINLAYEVWKAIPRWRWIRKRTACYVWMSLVSQLQQREVDRVPQN
jgi:hypothetical protein